MKKHLWVVCLASALVATAAVAQDRPQPAPRGGDDPELLAQHMADHGPGDEGPMLHRRVERRVLRERGPGMMLEGLDLTPAQRDKIGDIHERQMRKDIQARADIRIAMLDLHKMLRADKPDQRAIDAQIDKVADMRAGLGKAHVATMLEIRSTLTPEQQKKLRERHGMGMGRGMHRGMGMGMGMGMGEDEGDDWEGGVQEN